MDFILDVTAQGLAYSILAIGVLLTYQVLDYADLTLSLIHIFTHAQDTLMTINSEVNLTQNMIRLYRKLEK